MLLELDAAVEDLMKQSEELAAFAAAADRLTALLAPLDEERLNRAPFPGSWTPGQVGDHLRKSYGIARLFRGRTAPTFRPADQKVEAIDRLFLDFNIRMEAPEFIVPTAGPVDGKALLADLRERAAAIAAAGRAEDLSFTCLDFELPMYGTLTGLEWVHFLTTHTRRHLRQLEGMLAAWEAAPA